MPISESEISDLVEAAKEAWGRAYAPYSGFSVGAAVLAGSGKVYLGSNVENASYGLTVCAERVAIFKAVSEGEREIHAVAIVAHGDDIPRPCGACLQVMHEFAPSDDSLLILASTRDDSYDVYTLADYLPMPFSLR